MDRKYKLSIALDIDDVLMECVPYAIRLANEKYNFEPPLSIYEIDRWGKLGTRADVIFEFFDDPEFFKNQPVLEGAKEFVHRLTQIAEVFVATSIKPEFMGIRASRIMQEFPEISPNHIYMGNRKDKIDVDILFDDGMHNVFHSNATYPILLRRPWNQQATGILAVNTYEEFLKLVEVIVDSYRGGTQRYTLSQPSAVVLVGSTGSGKNEIAKEILERTDCFEKLVSYTTNINECSKDSENYHYVTTEEFLAMREADELFESTVYANNYYGSKKSDIEDILARGKHVLTVMDICGAMSLKTHFPHVITIYIKRDRREVLKDIVSRDLPVEEKVNRIIAIDSETQNAEICDYIVRVNSYEDAARQICRGLHIEEGERE